MNCTLSKFFAAGIAAGAVLAAAALQPALAETARAVMKNDVGESVGEVTLRQTFQGALLHARLSNLPPGAHAFHVHTVGKCEPPFTSAGGHFNPDGKEHGFDNAKGMHAGDMPNIHVPASGNLEIEILNALLALGPDLFDSDGSAIVIHAGPDDYRTDPAGDAGPRIACGVITQ